MGKVRTGEAEIKGFGLVWAPLRPTSPRRSSLHRNSCLVFLGGDLMRSRSKTAQRDREKTFNAANELAKILQQQQQNKKTEHEFENLYIKLFSTKTEKKTGAYV